LRCHKKRKISHTKVGNLCPLQGTKNADENPEQNTWNRGYEKIGSQILEAGTLPDIKEGFYIGEEISKSHPYFVQKKLNSGPNVWPSSVQNAHEFQATSMEYYKAMHALARDILIVLAQTLDLDERYFAEFTTGAVATLRYLHYPPQPKDSDEKLSRGIGAHTDFGSVTLLMQDEVAGLQVWEKTANEWLDVKPIKGAYVVNLGNMFMRWWVTRKMQFLSLMRQLGRMIVTYRIFTESSTNLGKSDTRFHFSTVEIPIM